MLQAALAATDDGRGPAGQRLVRRAARVHQGAHPGAAPGRRPRAARPKRPWSTERRALLAAEFLASDEAEELSDRQAASRSPTASSTSAATRTAGGRCGCRPAKVQNFMLGWLPRKVLLSRRPTRTRCRTWSPPGSAGPGRKRGLTEAAIGQTLDTLFDSMATFSRIYRDPAEFGLDEKLVARLLPDSDLEALPRRAFAFPVLEGKHGGVDLSKLDPADPADRRLLLAADHDTRTGSRRARPASAATSTGTWRSRTGSGAAPRPRSGTPRSGCSTRGEDRHMVLHALMDVLDAAGGDEAALEVGAARTRDRPERRRPERPRQPRLLSEPVQRGSASLWESVTNGRVIPGAALVTLGSPGAYCAGDAAPRSAGRPQDADPRWTTLPVRGSRLRRSRRRLGFR